MTTLTAPATEQQAPTASRRTVRRTRRRLSNGVASVVLVLFAALVLTPIYVLVVVSLHHGQSAPDNPFAFPTAPDWQNYRTAFVNMHYLRSVGNTLLITLATAALTVLTASLAAWAIVRHTRRWTRTVYQVFVSGLTIPIFVVLTPLYEVMQKLHLLDSYGGIVLAYAATTMPFAVFFFAGFLRTVPAELEEAAAVDGAGLLRTFARIVFPLLKPATATLAIFVVMQVWNDLILPLVLLSSDSKQTVTLAVYATIGTHTLSPEQLLPTLVLGVLPLFAVFLSLQRYVVAGIAVGVGK
ncbi:carbohydrate ABC transporter permease [Cellulomonas sp. SG140]|uniref:carbohydrate ABC transporter permease n=1 Tax=Cellulomonas sp. SG140 TaxID=2976536 RepID=UPI0021E98512|nr:carbohydrate ABC transporter permease [Cellulomonas sp. SG140]